MRFWTAHSLLALSLFLLSSTADAQYPRGVLAEDCTATWCGYCPYAYQGLEVMKNRYDATEFNSTRYYATSGGLGTAEMDARIDYYGVTGFPTVLFDGMFEVGGGSVEIATGSQYDPIVAAEIGRPSPFKITINSVDLVQPSGSIDFDVEVMETLASIANTQIRVLIMENNVTYSGTTYTDVTRDVLPVTTLTVSQLEQVQNVSLNFTLPAGWKTADLWAAVFVQKDTTKEILQSASTRPAPAYSLRYWAKDEKAVVRPSHSGLYEFPEFAVFNLGTQPDVIRATLQPGTLPSGWTCVFTDGLTEYTDYADLALNPGESRIFRMKIGVGDAGYAAPKVVLSSVNQPGKTRTIPYALITDDLQVLIVDDDGSAAYETYYQDALTQAGVSYGVWPAIAGQVKSTDLAQFDAVVWELGLMYPTLTASDRSALGTYLSGGGRLFITGQELGWEMNDSGGAAYSWYQNYLHVNFTNDDANRNILNGVAGDPISDGMTLNLNATLNPYPDIITPRDAMATTIFTYSGTSNSGAVRVDTGAYRVVYLAFGYEAITTIENRRLLLARAIEWLGVSSAGAPEPQASALLSVRAYPNPAPGGAVLTYHLPARGEVRLSIIRPDGGVLRTVKAGVEQAGTHSVAWDGRDSQGASAAAGIYFYRLETQGNEDLGGKLILMR